MKFAFEQTNDNKLEINYVIEQGTNFSNHLHLHCFIICNNKRKLIESIRLGFSRISYYQSDIFDLDGWKNYITKNKDEIKTLKKQNMIEITDFKYNPILLSLLVDYCIRTYEESAILDDWHLFQEYNLLKKNNELHFLLRRSI